MHCVRCKFSDFSGDSTRTGAICLNPQSPKYLDAIVTTDACRSFEVFGPHGELAVPRD